MNHVQNFLQSAVPTACEAKSRSSGKPSAAFRAPHLRIDATHRQRANSLDCTFSVFAAKEKRSGLLMRLLPCCPLLQRFYFLICEISLSISL